MGMLDYERFGNTGELGYQRQIGQFSDAITDIMRARAARAKLDAETSYRNAELAQKKRHDDLEQQRHTQSRNSEGATKVTELLAKGDTDGARLVGSQYGIEVGGEPPVPAPEASRPLPPDVRMLADQSRLPEPELHPPQQRPGLLDEQLHAPGQPVQEPPPDGIPAGDRAQKIAEDIAAVGQPKPEAPGDVSIQRTRTVTEPFAAEELPPEPPAAPKASTAVTVRLPDGRVVTVDHDTAQRAQRKQAADEFRTSQHAIARQKFLSAAGRPPEVAAKIRAEALQDMQDIDRVAAHLESGAAEPKAASGELEMSTRQRRAESFQSEQNQLNRDAAMARTRVSAAAAAAREERRLPQAGEPDPKVYARYQADVAEAKKNTLAAKDMQDMRLLDKLHAEFRNPNGPQHQLAIDTLTREAVGGRAPVQLAQNLQHAIGLYNSAANWAYKQTHNGQNLPEVVAMYRKAVDDSWRVSVAQRKADAAAFEEAAGTRSQHFRVPELRPYVLDKVREHYTALGLPVPDYARAQSDQPPANSGTARPTSTRKKQPPPTGDEVEDFINGH